MINTELGALIPREEFIRRQQCVQQDIQRRGFKAPVAWSKGGGTYDAYADVAYLANHYTAFPHIRDLKPRWTSRGHAAVVIPAAGDAALVVDMADYRDGLVVCPDVRYANDVIGAVAGVLRDRGSTTGTIGVSGSEFLLPGDLHGPQATPPSRRAHARR